VVVGVGVEVGVGVAFGVGTCSTGCFFSTTTTAANGVGCGVG